MLRVSYKYHMSWTEKVYCRLYQKKQRIKLVRAPYRKPEILRQWDDCVHLLSENNVKRVLLITEQSVSVNTCAEVIKNAFDEIGLQYSLYICANRNNRISDVENASTLYLQDNCDGIMAVGGSMIMDCAKLSAAKIVRQDLTVRGLCGVMQIQSQLPMLIAVPTVAGTGCEAATITGAVSDKLKLKWLAYDTSLIPDYVLMIPEWMTDLSSCMLAACGMSTLAQAIEAYIGRDGTEQCKQYAKAAVSVLHKCLKNACRHPENVEAREKMLLASHYADLSHLQAFPGYVYAMANAFSMQCDISLEMAQAMVLPVILQHYGKSCYKELAQLAKDIGIVSEKISAAKAAQEFIDWIYDFNRDMGIPSKYLLSEVDIAYITMHTLHEANPLYPVPKLMGYDELELILRAISQDVVT